MTRHPPTDGRADPHARPKRTYLFVAHLPFVRRRDRVADLPEEIPAGGVGAEHRVVRPRLRNHVRKGVGAGHFACSCVPDRRTRRPSAQSRAIADDWWDTAGTHVEPPTHDRTDQTPRLTREKSMPCAVRVRLRVSAPRIVVRDLKPTVLVFRGLEVQQIARRAGPPKVASASAVRQATAAECEIIRVELRRRLRLREGWVPWSSHSTK